MPAEDVAIESLLADDRFVRTLARRIVRDAASAEDVVQETYLEALRRRPSAAVSLRGWAGAVIRHLASNLRRSQARRERRERRAARPEGQAPETLLLEREETRRRLVDAVLALRAPRSTVLILRYFEDLPPRAIARRLGMPVETVRTHLKRGLAELRVRFVTERREDGTSMIAALPLLLPRPPLASAAIGVAAMTTATKIALSGTAVVAALIASLALRGRGDRTDSPEPAHESPEATVAVRAPAPPAVPEEPQGRVSLVAAEQRGEPENTPVARPPGVLRGIVLDPDGRPVEGAAIRGAPRGVNRGFFKESYLLAGLVRGETWTARRDVRPDGSFESASGPDGTFEVVGLPPDDAFDVAAWVGALGLVVVEGVPVRAEWADPIMLRFSPAIVLHGEVTDREEVPLTDAAIGVMGSHDGTTYSSWPFSFRVGEDGTWRTPPLARKSFHVMARAAGYRRGDRLVSWDRRTDRALRVDFRLEPAPILRGTVVRPDGSAARLAETLGGLDRSPEALALVASEMEPASESNFLEFHTRRGAVDADRDRWEVETEYGVPRLVSLWCATTLLGVASPSAGEETEIVVDLGRLTRGASRRPVVVTVRDRDGRPVVGAQGLIRPAVDDARAIEARFRPTVFLEGKEGTLSAGGVEPGAYELRIWAEGFVPRRFPIEVESGIGLAPFAVGLSPASHRIQVAVRTSAGEPVAGARIHVLDGGGLPVDLSPAPTTNLEGQVEVEGLGEGRYDLLTAHGSFAAVGRRVWLPSASSEVPLTLGDGEDIRIEARGTLGPFSFRIEDSGGVAVHEDACVDGRHYEGKTFRLAPGSYQVTVRCPGFEPGRATFDAERGARVLVPLTPSAR